MSELLTVEVSARTHTVLTAELTAGEVALLRVFLGALERNRVKVGGDYLKQLEGLLNSGHEEGTKG